MTGTSPFKRLLIIVRVTRSRKERQKEKANRSEVRGDGQRRKERKANTTRERPKWRESEKNSTSKREATGKT